MNKKERLVVKTFSKLKFPVIINSYGRSGSTVLTNSIIKNAIRNYTKVFNRTAYTSISQEAWDLENTIFRDGVVYKTHDYPPHNISKKNIRIIYIYADPVDVVLSLLRLHKEKGEDWIRVHCSHLKTDYDNFSDIIEKDQLHLKKHLTSWLAEEKFPILFVKYERLWDYQDDISSFLELPVTLPERKVRKSKKEMTCINSSQLNTVNKTYQDLKEQINSLENIFINNKHLLKRNI